MEQRPGYKAVKYAQLPFHMLQAIKELKVENDGSLQAIKQLRTENAALKQQLRAQAKRVRTQETRLRRLEALARK